MSTVQIHCTVYRVNLVCCTDQIHGYVWWAGSDQTNSGSHHPSGEYAVNIHLLLSPGNPWCCLQVATFGVVLRHFPLQLFLSRLLSLLEINPGDICRHLFSPSIHHSAASLDHLQMLLHGLQVLFAASPAHAQWLLFFLFSCAHFSRVTLPDKSVWLYCIVLWLCFYSFIK